MKRRERVRSSPLIALAAESHLEAVWTIVDRCRVALSAAGVAQWDAQYPSRQTIGDAVARQGTYVALVDDVCRATVAIDDHQDPEYRTVAWTTVEPALVVHRLCVDPDFEGRGLANALMSFAESYAAEQGYESIRLDAYSANPRAVAFYQRRGYWEAGRVRFPRRPLPFLCFERPVSRGDQRHD